jgi:hypothetical protein
MSTPSTVASWPTHAGTLAAITLPGKPFTTALRSLTAHPGRA